MLFFPSKVRCIAQLGRARTGGAGAAACGASSQGEVLPTPPAHAALQVLSRLHARQEHPRGARAAPRLRTPLRREHRCTSSTPWVPPGRGTPAAGDFPLVNIVPCPAQRCPCVGVPRGLPEQRGCPLLLRRGAVPAPCVTRRGDPRTAGTGAAGTGWEGAASAPALWQRRLPKSNAEGKHSPNTSVLKHP